MKVVFPIGSFFPSQEGGPSNSVYLLAKELAKYRSMEVSVIATDKGITQNSVNLNEWTRLDDFSVIYIQRKVAWYWVWFRTTYRAIRCADVVHLTSLFYPPSIIASILSYFLKKPVIWSIRGEVNEDALSFAHWKKSLVIPILVWLSKRHPRLKFHSTSEKEQNEAKRSFLRANSIVVPNGIGGAIAAPRSNQNKELLYLGRLHPIKNIDLLISSFAKSNLPAKKYRLTIAGKGEPNYEEYLRGVVKKCGVESVVHFSGHVQGKNKVNLIEKADWLVLLSKSENFGNVILEALQSATPVVVSINTPWKQVPLFNAGYQVDATEGDVCEVFNSIASLSIEQYNAHQRGALDLLIRHYDISSVALQWKTEYENA